MINGKTLSRLIDSIYQSAITGDWQSSINAIRKYTNSNKIFFVIRDLKTGEPITVEFLASFDYNPDILLHYADVMDEDPWYQLSQLGLEGDVMHLSKLLPVESFKDSNIYKTIFKPMHLVSFWQEIVNMKLLLLLTEESYQLSTQRETKR